MRAVWLTAAALVAVTATPAVAARTVEYPTDETVWQGWATEQGVALAPWGTLPPGVALVVGPGVDHQVVRAGIYCSKWTVDNPMTALFKSAAAAWRVPAVAPVGGAVLTVTGSSAFSRCVGSGEMKSICITRVSIDGSLTRNGQSTPVRVSVEQSTKGVGVCAGLTRGIGLVSRSAVAAFAAKAAEVR